MVGSCDFYVVCTEDFKDSDSSAFLVDSTVRTYKILAFAIVLITKNNSPSTVEKTNYFEGSTKFKLSLNFRLIMAQ